MAAGASFRSSLPAVNPEFNVGDVMCLLQVKMPPMMEIITAEQLMEYLGEEPLPLHNGTFILTVLMK